MSKTIIVGSLEIEASNWQETSLFQPAGWAPEAQAAHEAEMLRQGIVTLRPGEASFTCAFPQTEGTRFSLKDDNRNFVVTFVSGQNHRAMSR